MRNTSIEPGRRGGCGQNASGAGARVHVSGCIHRRRQVCRVGATTIQVCWPSPSLPRWVCAATRTTAARYAHCRLEQTAPAPGPRQLRASHAGVRRAGRAAPEQLPAPSHPDHDSRSPAPAVRNNLAGHAAIQGTDAHAVSSTDDRAGALLRFEAVCLFIERARTA